MCRQLVLDPNGQLLAWYRTLPEDVRAATSIRVWQGLQPPLDILGRHEGSPHGRALFDDKGLRLPDSPHIAAAGWSMGHATRQAVLIGATDSQDPMGSQTIPLVVLQFDGAQVAFPGSLAGDLGPAIALDEHTWHTHTGEGNALLYHLMRCTPRASWPDGLARSTEVARSIVGGEPGLVG